MIETLARGGKAGLLVPVRKDYFKYPAASHFVFYRPSDSGLHVIRILHQSMDVSARLAE